MLGGLMPAFSFYRRHYVLVHQKFSLLFPIKTTSIEFKGLIYNN